MTTRRERLIYPIGVMWIAHGILTVMVPEIPDPGLPHQMVADSILSGLWVGTGLLAILLTAAHLRHAIPALIVMPAGMSASFLLDALASLTSPNPPGQWAAWPQFAYWLALTALLWSISGWRIARTEEGTQGDAAHVAGDSH